ncbi:hypothetical protein FRB90_009622 [Tulasnella sp. 427]|nr:hypothetical protein FRB90_009622 [Tulasnella sp. 427]
MAAVEKEKGNTAFRAGKFAEAVGHYSAAIFLDRNDATLPLNRAAAYLKLGKNEDAERDCSTVLALAAGKNNVKALFRRFQARMALGRRADAEQDLREALRIEPQNEAVKKELQQFGNILDAPAPASKSPAPVTTKPYRRRVPISIVERPESSSLSRANKLVTSPSNVSDGGRSSDTSALLNPVSTRPIKTEEPTRSTSQLPSAASSSTQSLAKQQDSKYDTREINWGKVEGGVFRYNPPTNSAPEASPSVVTNRPKTSKSTSSSTLNSSEELSKITSQLEASSLKAPTTLYDFTRAWNGERSSNGKWKVINASTFYNTHGSTFMLLISGYFPLETDSIPNHDIQLVPPDQLPKLFRTSLEAGLVMDIVRTFEDLLSSSTPRSSTDFTADSQAQVFPSDPSTRDIVRQYMASLATAPRFEFVRLFLDDSEKETVRKVLHGVSETDGDALAKSWGV